MKYEKIIRREDGSRIKISVYVYVDSFGGCKPIYSFETSKCGKGKRTFIYPHNTNDYVWRGLNIKDRKEYSQNKYLSIATKEEVMEAFMELHELMSPSDNIFI